MSKRQVGNYMTDPGFPLVMTSMGPKPHQKHNIVVAELVHAIYKQLSNSINYDHIRSTVPKEHIPLVFQGKRHDITYLTVTGDQVFIEVRIKKKRRRP